MFLKAEHRFSHNNACNVCEFKVTLIAFLIYETIVACGGGSLSFPLKSNKHPGIDFKFVSQKAFFVMLLLNRRHSIAFEGEFLARVRGEKLDVRETMIQRLIPLPHTYATPLFIPSYYDFPLPCLSNSDPAVVK